MNTHKIYIKKILLIFLTFWILPFLSILLIFITKRICSIPIQHMNYSITVSFYDILLRNISIYFIIITLGFLNKFFPYIIYYYNSIMFTGISIMFMDNFGIKSYLCRVLPHGIIEILGFSIAVYIGINIKHNKNKKIFFLLCGGALLIFCAALIEIALIHDFS
ncbi:stage II sporulation protein M [Clostridium sporogenes]|uniref:Stage II sporulation protein M n=2 Tax=Clostridium sporogenes TaxID=1509 RepID=A0AAE4FQ53_CLOSG|nr:stage II sporulation protein M [Clostridium sporogenes]MDS1005225.1 stage II sporulation protein M [Clostridium sporogenes]